MRDDRFFLVLKLPLSLFLIYNIIMETSIGYESSKTEADRKKERKKRYKNSTYATYLLRNSIVSVKVSFGELSAVMSRWFSCVSSRGYWDYWIYRRVNDGRRRKARRKSKKVKILVVSLGPWKRTERGQPVDQSVSPRL